MYKQSQCPSNHNVMYVVGHHSIQCLLLRLTCSVPVGLEDVSKYPNLFAELIRRGYSDSDLQKIARGNLIRVFKAVEGVCCVFLLTDRSLIIDPHTHTGERQAERCVSRQHTDLPRAYQYYL